MANPQLEDGYTKISNQIIDALAKVDLNGTEQKVLWCIFRYTYGFNRKSHKLSATFIAKYGNCSIEAVKKAIKRLKNENIVLCVNSEKRGVCSELMFNKNFDEWKSNQCTNGHRCINVHQCTNGHQTSVQTDTATGVQSYTQEIKNINKKSKEIYNVEQSPTSDVFREVIDYLNQRTGKHFRPENKTTRRHINARIKDGYSLEDLKRVIDLKAGEWMGTEMEKYLRPETLFAGKFEGYLNSCPAAVQKKIAPAQEEDEQPIDYSNYEREW